MKSYVYDGSQVNAVDRFRGISWVFAFLLIAAALLVIGFAADTSSTIAPPVPGNIAPLYGPPISVVVAPMESFGGAQ